MARGETIILTGASKGIGLATLQILLAEPFSSNVITISRTKSPQLVELMEAYPDQLKVHEGDVTNESDNERVVKLAIESYGKIDGLILNAGTIEFGKAVESGLESWKRVFDVNFFSLISILQHAIHHLRSSKGRIVFVSSGASMVGRACISLHRWSTLTTTIVYHLFPGELTVIDNTSKAAVNSLARTLANEEPDITCVAIRPGVVDTDMQVQLRKTGSKEMRSDELDRFIKLYTSDQLLPPSKPAKVIATLSMGIPTRLNGEFVSWDSDEVSKLTDQFPVTLK